MTGSAVQPEPHAMVTRSKRKLSWLVRVGLSLGLLGAALWMCDLESVAAALRHASWGGAVLLGLLAAADRALMGYKWNLLMRSGGASLTHGHAIRLYFEAYLVGSIAPGSVGSDAYRVVALRRHVPARLTLSTILLERGIGLVVIALWAMITLPWLITAPGQPLRSWVAWLSGGTAFAIAALVLSLHPQLGRQLRHMLRFARHLPGAGALARFHDAYLALGRHPRTLVVFACLTVVEVAMLFTMNFVAARSLGLDVSLGYFFCAMPLVHMAVRIPISFQGLGVQEGMLAWALVQAGYSPADGVAVSLLQRLVEIVAVMLPAAVLMIWKVNDRSAGPIAPVHIARHDARANR